MPLQARLSMQGRVLLHRAHVLPVVLVVVALALSACGRVPGVYTYESKAAAAAPGAKSFNAKSYVDGIWSSKVLATVDAKAVAAGTLLAAIKKDPAAAGKQYGRQSGTGSPPSFLVKGTGTVTAVDTSTPTGPVALSVAGAPASPKVFLTTGPVIAGTSLRDAVGFIDFSQFTNQLDYADVATQLNTRVKTDVLAKVDKASLKGKKVTFEGAFSLLDPANILVVPTKLEVGP
jgi:predicted lipoprotein